MLDTFAALAPVCAPAEVLEVDASRRVRVQSASLDDECWATLAVASPVRAGQQVLVVGQDPSELFAIAVLNAEPAEAPQTVESHGARAEVTGQGTEERLCVYSKRGELLFEHDPAADRSRVLVPESNLDIVTAGNLNLAARGSINLLAEDVNVSAKQSLKLSVRSAIGKILSQLNIGRRRSEWKSTEVAVEAQQATIEANEVEAAGQHCRTKFDVLRTAADRLESTARVIVQQAQSAYHTARDLFQIDAQRTRTHVRETHHLDCKNALLRADEDFKVDGEQIHLG